MPRAAAWRPGAGPHRDAGGAGQSRDRRALDDLAGMHHDDAMAVGGGEREIVRDEQRRHAARARQVADQRHDRGLGRDVETRGRLVGDQQFGLAAERQGDADALALAAGQLERIVDGLGRIESDAFQQGRDRSLPATSRSCRPTVLIGLRLARGFWKIWAIAARVVRRSRIGPIGAPCQRISPPTMRAAASSSPLMA